MLGKFGEDRKGLSGWMDEEKGSRSMDGKGAFRGATGLPGCLETGGMAETQSGSTS